MTTMTDMMSQFSTYDEARQYYDNMLIDRRRYGDFNMEVRSIQTAFANNRIPLEDQKEAKHELDVYTKIRDRIEGRFYERYQVNYIDELSKKIRDFGPRLEERFGQEVQS